jgi:hypothetical protein
MEEFNNIGLFQDYLIGDLSPADKTTFELRLKEDKEFSDEFNEFRLLEQDIEEVTARNVAKFELKTKFNRHIVVDDYNEGDDQGELAKPASTRSIQIRRWSIAASVLLIAVFSFVFWPAKNIDKPIAEFLDIDSIPHLAKKLSCHELDSIYNRALIDYNKAENDLTKQLQNNPKGFGPLSRKLRISRDQKQKVLKEINLARSQKCSDAIPFDVEEGFELDTSILDIY